jgi:hypothetical protein
MRASRSLLVLVMAGAMAGFLGCGDDTTEPEVDVTSYLAPTSEKNVLENLKRSWERKDIAAYVACLADDYQFYFDEDTRIGHGLPVFWTRLDDSLGVARLFACPYVRSITVRFTGMGEPQAVTQAGRTNWTKIDVTNSFVEVIVNPNPEQPEGMTYRVQSSLQHFYFRKGRTAADTLASSPTSSRYYIVEWDDLGHGDYSPKDRRPASGAGPADALSAPGPAGENTTWGAIKNAYR